MAREPLMDRARELAERGRYTAAPNPLVGSVIVQDGNIIGEGWHARAGGDHAEVAALKSNGSSVSGSTMYVTLEPCNHHGRTPPCTDAILDAGIEHLVIGHLDPDPRMRGKSVEILRRAGLEVEVLDDGLFECQNEQFFHYMRTARPFVHLKLAASLDGRIATRTGDSRWVTGEAARERAHLLRAEAGAVLVGAGTVRADDPLLTARGLTDMPPDITRVVLDPRLTTSADSQLACTAHESPVLIFAGDSSLDGRDLGLSERGVEVVAAPSTTDGLDLNFVLDELGRRGIRGLLVEGGGETAGRFVAARLADKLTVFYAPWLLGPEGVPMIGSLLSPEFVAEAPRFSVSDVEQIGDDIAVTLYPGEQEGHVHGDR
ncbi:MAG: bifunctional diaminohydroxyphosphoribosylaminopyrimidine deaminase/5-amino-6-(5-phosphoribosylamino)uracil reductase RibD [Rubrobacteraceae bacterium]